MKTRAASDAFIVKPEEHEAIKEEARKLLKRAKALGIFPTPIDALMDAADIEQITDLEEAKKSFFRSVPKHMQAAFTSAWGKLRGFADLKKKVTYVAPDTPIREIWPKLHELGHQTLIWQNVNVSYVDDQRSLSHDCEELFDREANDFAGEVLFQGEVFTDLSKSLYPDFNSIFHLADKFGASRHATARHFAGESDEPTALISYYPNHRAVSVDGKPALMLGRAHTASEKFIRKYPDLRLPNFLPHTHQWATAIDEGQAVSGSQIMDCGDGTTAKFLWEAWWNTYGLMVLIRKAPKLKIVTDIFS